MTAAALGIDGGASGTRWRLVGARGATLAEGRAGPLTGHVFAPASRAATRATVAALCREVAEAGRPARVVAGISGLAPGDAAAGAIGGWIARALSLKPAAVEIFDDMQIAYLGAFAPGEGILVYAGTGAVAWHLTASGAVERAGGHGYLLDDSGGGFWIGREALRAMLRRRDEGVKPTALDAALRTALGADDWSAIRAFVYGGGRSAVASLAATVGRVASRGDREAIALLEAAASELVRLAAVLVARVGTLPVALAGGVARGAPALRRAFAVALPRGITLRPPPRAPVATAAALARAALSAAALKAPRRSR